jgi:hypothetical protein
MCQIFVNAIELFNAEMSQLANQALETSSMMVDAMDDRLYFNSITYPNVVLQLLSNC